MPEPRIASMGIESTSRTSKSMCVVRYFFLFSFRHVSQVCLRGDVDLALVLLPHGLAPIEVRVVGEALQRRCYVEADAGFIGR